MNNLCWLCFQEVSGMFIRSSVVAIVPLSSTVSMKILELLLLDSFACSGWRFWVISYECTYSPTSSDGQGSFGRGKIEMPDAALCRAAEAARLDMLLGGVRTTVTWLPLRHGACCM